MASSDFPTALLMILWTLRGYSDPEAGVTVSGAHRLRHTFCSHLAMRGAPARAIQALPGHQNLSTTERYMHLSPAALDKTIRLLDSPSVSVGRGEMLETGIGEARKASG